MAHNKKLTGMTSLILVALLFSGCGTRFFSGCPAPAPEPAQSVVAPEKPAAAVIKSFPVFELPMPQSEAEKSYLGLTGTGTFQITQIKAPVLLIEIFSFYCPYCQDSAPQVNEFYQLIQARPELKEKIKLIGIGSSNSSFEVNSFREKYQVPFPLFPDQKMEIFKMLGARGTPTFIGVRVNDQGLQEQFYLGEGAGAFQNTSQFLNEIIKLSGIKAEVK